MFVFKKRYIILKFKYKKWLELTRQRLSKKLIEKEQKEIEKYMKNNNKAKIFNKKWTMLIYFHEWRNNIRLIRRKKFLLEEKAKAEEIKNKYINVIMKKQTEIKTNKIIKNTKNELKNNPLSVKKANVLDKNNKDKKVIEDKNKTNNQRIKPNPLKINLKNKISTIIPRKETPKSIKRNQSPINIEEKKQLFTKPKVIIVENKNNKFRKYVNDMNKIKIENVSDSEEEPPNLFQLDNNKSNSTIIEPISPIVSPRKTEKLSMDKRREERQKRWEELQLNYKKKEEERKLKEEEDRKKEKEEKNRQLKEIRKQKLLKQEFEEQKRYQLQLMKEKEKLADIHSSRRLLVFYTYLDLLWLKSMEEINENNKKK